MDPNWDGLDTKTKKKCYQCPWVRIPRRYMISYKSKNKNRWDLLILLFAVYNSLMIPFEQAFKSEYFENAIVKALDNIIDIVFIFDLLLMFCTSVINKKGFESYDHQEVSDCYTETVRFKIDCISILGTSLF